MLIEMYNDLFPLENLISLIQSPFPYCKSDVPPVLKKKKKLCDNFETNDKVHSQQKMIGKIDDAV